MAQLIPQENEIGDPEVQCSECEVIFTVIWNNNGYTTGVEYCPFCGVEFESQVSSDR